MCRACECEGGGRVSEGEKMQSSACLSGHTIQHREKPFIQHSLPILPSKLPSNSVRPQLTRWHGSIAWPPPPPPPISLSSPLLSPRPCLFFTASSSFSFCPSSPPPSTHSLFPSVNLLSFIVRPSFCISWHLSAIFFITIPCVLLSLPTFQTCWLYWTVYSASHSTEGFFSLTCVLTRCFPVLLTHLLSLLPNHSIYFHVVLSISLVIS